MGKLNLPNPDKTVNYNKHSLENRTDIIIKLQTYFVFPAFILRIYKLVFVKEEEEEK